jgi:hypothetical protein
MLDRTPEVFRRIEIGPVVIDDKSNGKKPCSSQEKIGVWF